MRQRRFYNVGAEAQFHHAAWTKVNHPSTHYGSEQIDIQWDLMSDQPLPIEDGQAKVVFSRYTLEHATNEAVEHFLSEAYRTLANDGFLRVIVPDIEIYYAAYQLKDEAFFYRPKHDLKTFPNDDFLSNINAASFEQKFLWNFASSASVLHADGAAERISDQEFRRIFAELSFEDALDHCTAKCSLEVQRRHPENHINWFTAGKLQALIRKAGFTRVYRSGYGQSLCPVLRDSQLLEARDPEVGLFIEAQK
ncbi:MAG TPA: class I SAM-dependent methyltransferase [Anaerolineales bacterium]|nr:class I SAM-dependent methyltransferase [Anaerolineales bacterium]